MARSSSERAIRLDFDRCKEEAYEAVRVTHACSFTRIYKHGLLLYSKGLGLKYDKYMYVHTYTNVSRVCSTCMV